MHASHIASVLNLSIINVISESAQQQLLEVWNEEVRLYPQNVEQNFGSRVLRLNHEKIQIACQIIGCKPNIAKSISDTILNYYKSLIEPIYSQIPQNSPEVYSMYTTNEKLIELLSKKLADFGVTKKRSLLDFEIGLSIIEQTRPMIVLLGGTSGSGKSTVASLLASRFGMSTVLSTDSIRHIMRNFMTTDECPILFASTYEAGNKIKVDEGTSEKKRVVKGFKQQAAIVQERIDNIIQGFFNRGESIIVEGVHLTPDFMAAMISKYNNCIPFLVYIRSENKHRERFAVRSKYMTLEKKHNKYIQHFTNIRDIQKHLTKKADEFLVPKVNNSNIDKSVGLIHRTIIRCLRRVAIGENLFDFEKKNGLKIYLQFNEVTKNIWSSESVKQYINTKISNFNKVENVQRFLFKENEEIVSLNRKTDSKEKIFENQNQNVDEAHGDNEEKDEEEPTQAEEVEPGLEDLKKIDSQFKYKEDILLLNEDSFDSKSHPKSAISKKKQSKGLSGSDMEQSPENFKSIQPIVTIKGNLISLDHKESLENQEFRLPNKSLKMDKEEEKSFENNTNGIHGQALDAFPALIKKIDNNSQEYLHSSTGAETPVLRPSRNHLKFRELEELISEKRSISIKGTMTQYYLKRIKKFVDHYNKRHADSFVKLYPHNERYLLFRHNRSDATNNLDSAGEQIGNKTALPIKFLRKGDQQTKSFEQRSTARYTESGASDGDVEASEDDGSLVSGQSQEKSSFISGSLDVNFQVTARASNAHNLSDHHQDFSDDFESVAKLDEDGNSEGKTSLEIVESANSISEQSDEDIEDEDVIICRPPKLVK